jgi:hypothetical protein
MFIFVVPTLQKRQNKIRMKELAGGKYMENDCFLKTLKFEMINSKQRQWLEVLTQTSLFLHFGILSMLQLECIEVLKVPCIIYS